MQSDDVVNVDIHTPAPVSSRKLRIDAPNGIFKRIAASNVYRQIYRKIGGFLKVYRLIRLRKPIPLPRRSSERAAIITPATTSD
jgi:hypothetical protein